MKSILFGLGSLITIVTITGCAAWNIAKGQSSAQAQTTTASDRSTPVSPEEVMSRVADRYSGLKSYSSRGTNVRKANFNGKEEAPVETNFTIRYERRKGGSIEWNDAGHQKKFTFDGATNLLQEDGRVTKSFPNTLDALMTVELSSAGYGLFDINLFVFRDELKLGDRFFLTIQDPVVSEDCVVDGHQCYLLSGKLKKFDGTISYWIDKQDSSVRKTERVLNVRRQEPNKQYVRTTTITEEHRDIQIE